LEQFAKPKATFSPFPFLVPDCKMPAEWHFVNTLIVLITYRAA